MTVLRLFICMFMWAGFNVGAVHAHDQNLSDLLQQIQQAARSLDYAGLLSYSTNQEVQNLNLIHVVDGKGERERLETLDGPAREYLRLNDSTQCLLPEQQLIIIEPSRDDRFPALLTGDTAHIADYYTLEKAELQRVGGRECQQYRLYPTDQWRYGYALCIDTEHQLLLKSQTLSVQQVASTRVLSERAFAKLDVGEQVDVSALDSGWQYNDWRIIAAQMEPTQLAAQGWRIPYPAGFEPVSEVSRYIRSERQVAQLVLSDGLASISLFIEPVDDYSQRLKADPGSKKGSMHLFRKRIGDYWLTATGEVPLETLHYIANGTEFVPVDH